MAQQAINRGSSKLAAKDPTIASRGAKWLADLSSVKQLAAWRIAHLEENDFRNFYTNVKRCPYFMVPLFCRAQGHGTSLFDAVRNINRESPNTAAATSVPAVVTLELDSSSGKNAMRVSANHASIRYVDLVYIEEYLRAFYEDAKLFSMGPVQFNEKSHQFNLMKFMDATSPIRLQLFHGACNILRNEATASGKNTD